MTEKPHTNRWLIAMRYGLPAVIVIGGLMTMVVSPKIDTAEGAMFIIGAGLSILMINVMYRLGVKGDHEIDVDEAARDYLDRTGHWPDEEWRPYFLEHGRWPDPSYHSGRGTQDRRRDLVA